MGDLYNASDPRQIRAAAKRAKAVDAEHRVVITNLMSSLAGRAWVYSLLSAAHMFQTSFSPNSLSMAFAEGERNLGLRILGAVVAHCPDQYLAMMREAQEKEDGRRSGNDRPTGDREDRGWDDSSEPGRVESEYQPGIVYDDFGDRIE